MSIKESALSAITSISNSDFLRVVTSSGASRRITLANLSSVMLGNIAGISSAQTILISNNASVSGSVSNSARGLIVVSGGNDGAKGLYIFNVTSAGGLSFKTVDESSGVSVASSSNNTITFSNTSGYAVRVLVISY